VRDRRADGKNTILRVRNFYAPQSVKLLSNSLHQPYRALYHGRIEHGAQFVNPALSLLATTFYAPDSGGALAIGIRSTLTLTLPPPPRFFTSVDSKGR
jgi:hypothetical protein